MQRERSEKRWIEVWICPESAGEHLLVLRSAENGACEVVDPQRAWNQVHTFESYEAAYYWLRQETFELVEGRWPSGR